MALIAVCDALKRTASSKWTSLLAGAFAVRLLTVIVLWSPSSEPRAYEHGEIAANLLSGRGFSVRFLGVDGPTSQQAPFYPALLAAAYALFGVATPQSELAVQFTQCIAGTALVVAVVHLTRAVVSGPSSLPWIAGWGAALYPPHVYMVTHQQVALWTALWLTLLAAWVLSSHPDSPARIGIVLGLLSGLMLLTEPILSVSLPILAAALWQRSHRFVATVLMTAVALVVIAPWLIRNRVVHGEFVFIKSTFGYAFWQGNNPASWGTDKIPKPSADALRDTHNGSLADMNQALWEARHETLYIDDVLLKPHGYARFQGLTEPERSRVLLHEATQFIRERPVDYAQLCWRRLRYLLLFDDTNPKAAHSLYRASTIVWLSMALIGLVASRRAWRNLWPTYAIVATVLAFHTLTITSARFRIPLEPLTFIWCAAGVVAIYSPLAAVVRLSVSSSPSISTTLERSSPSAWR